MTIMSVRPVNSVDNAAAYSRSAVGASSYQTDEPLSFDQLTATEKNAASLGVDPDAFKPISFLNTAHYTALLKANALSSELAQRIESFKAVASGES